MKGIKRNRQTHHERFCLSFYITHDHCNLYHIKRPHADHYLAYRIAHSIPLYTKTGHDTNHLLHENSRIYAHLPNFPHYLPCTIHNKRPYTSKPNKIQHIIETIHGHRRGDMIERIIKTLRLPIIRRKKKRNRHHQHIITSDTMLKFHHDKRDIVFDLLRVAKERNQ